MPGSVISSTYCACPVTLSRPSLRGTDIPTMRVLLGESVAIEFDYRIRRARATAATPDRLAVRKKRRPQTPAVRGDTWPSPLRAKFRRDRVIKDSGSAVARVSTERL